MKLSKNSWHSRVYQYVYCTYNLPDNLCSYFWPAMLAVILLPISFIFTLPYFIASLYDKYQYKLSVERYDPRDVYCTSFAMWFFIGLLTIVILIIIWAVLYLFGYHSEGNEISLLLIMLILVISLIVFSMNRWDKRKESEVKKPNIFVEQFKAVKNKYCPKVEWTED